MLGKCPLSASIVTAILMLVLNRHYVAFIRKHIAGEKEESWVLFNDEKVVKAVDVDEMKKFAYVYFFQRL